MDGSERMAYWDGAERMGEEIRERLAAQAAPPKVLREVEDLLARARSHNQGEFRFSLGLK